jgi:hypothetical protein
MCSKMPNQSVHSNQSGWTDEETFSDESWDSHQDHFNFYVLVFTIRPFMSFQGFFEDPNILTPCAHRCVWFSRRSFERGASSQLLHSSFWGRKRRLRVVGDRTKTNVPCRGGNLYGKDEYIITLRLLNISSSGHMPDYRTWLPVELTTTHNGCMRCATWRRQKHIGGGWAARSTTNTKTKLKSWIMWKYNLATLLHISKTSPFSIYPRVGLSPPPPRWKWNSVERGAIIENAAVAEISIRLPTYQVPTEWHCQGKSVPEFRVFELILSASLSQANHSNPEYSCKLNSLNALVF